MNGTRYLLSAFALLGLAGCAKSPARVEAKPPAPFAAKTAAATERPQLDGLEATGTLAALESADVVAESEGVVEQTLVEPGQFVNAGAPLVRLKTTRSRLRLEQAQANEEQTDALFEQARLKCASAAEQQPEPLAAQAQLAGAEAELVAAQAEARRCERLVQTGDVSRAELERARASAQAAEARKQAAAQQYQAALRAARQDLVQVRAAAAQRQAARAAAAFEAQQVRDAVVRAPFAGFVSHREVSPGEWVGAGGKVATVEKVQPLRVLLQAPETALARLRPGAPVTLQAAAFPNEPLTAVVETIHPAVAPETRTITLEARLPNADRRWKPGMFVRATVEASVARPAVFVPRGALTQDAATDAAIVWSVADGRARVHPVRAGAVKGAEVEIRTGLAAGAKVIVNPGPALFDGAPVTEAR